MAETVDTKPVFREAFRRRRCLVPVEAFYEWKRIGPKEKQPYAIALADRGFMARAGLWENWKSPAEEWVRSFTIITTTPNGLCAPIHDRMPVILPPVAWPAWLGEQTSDSDRLKALLRPYPAAEMTAWPVIARVGNVKNNDPALIDPVSYLPRGEHQRRSDTHSFLPIILGRLRSTSMKSAAVALLVTLWAGTAAYAQQLTCTQAAANCRTACPDNNYVHTYCPGMCQQKLADCMKTGTWQRVDGATFPARKE